MKIVDILSQDAIICNAEATSKKQLLGMFSELAAEKTGLDERLIIDALIERERLGTTGIGRGVALPHTRLASLKNIFCAFIKTTPVDFESVYDKPVDLAFLLLVPEDAGADHLKALARLSRLLRDETVSTALRQATDPETVYNLIKENDTED
jgi:PTS system nitrogen regulatory IIA component